MDFDKFLENFIAKNEFYIPKNQSENFLRHFGERSSEGLLLRKEEVLYLFDKTKKHKDLKIRSYFDLKNSNYNILYNQFDKTKVYNKTRHFNREKETEIGILYNYNQEESFEEAIKDISDQKLIFSVEGWDDYCVVEVKAISKPDRDINEKSLLKRSKKD